jgi:prepilin-type N-terminal cleavage/methylation domain-containing protein
MSVRYSQQQVFLGMLLSFTSAIEYTKSSSFRRKPESRSLHHVLPVFDFGGNKKGFTLIELIIFIIIGAIILPASFVAFTAAIKHFSTPDYYVKARFYAEQKMEELTSNAYNSPNIVVTNTVLDPTPLDAGFQRRWSICHILSSNPDQCVSYDPTNEPNYNYKKLNVSITMPDNSIFDVSTIVTRRPKS